MRVGVLTAVQGHPEGGGGGHVHPRGRQDVRGRTSTRRPLHEARLLVGQLEARDAQARGA